MGELEDDLAMQFHFPTNDPQQDMPADFEQFYQPPNYEQVGPFDN